MTVRLLHAIINISEAAEIVGVSADTMRDLIVRDQARLTVERFIPSARNMGRDWAMLRTDVEAFAKIDRRPGRPRLAHAERIESRYAEPEKHPI